MIELAKRYGSRPEKCLEEKDIMSYLINSFVMLSTSEHGSAKLTREALKQLVS